MKNRIYCPKILDESTFENLINQLDKIGVDFGMPVTIDLSKAQFIDPYGILGLLEIGRYLSERDLSLSLILPHSEEVIKYMERLDFFKIASELFSLDLDDAWPQEPFFRSPHSDVLLETRKIEGTDDIHNLVEEVRQRAETILTSHLKYDANAIDYFVVALSEVCQNIPEHSEDIGYVGIQKYFYGKKLGKNIVKIAVMDLGVGIRESLTPKYAPSVKNWSDLEAINLALFKGASRFDDPGRGQGLTQVRKLVERWKGKLMIRSGTARSGIIPPWEISRPKRSSLKDFPGTQISIILPEKFS
jgi:hypothetical protein